MKCKINGIYGRRVCEWGYLSRKLTNVKTKLLITSLKTDKNSVG